MNDTDQIFTPEELTLNEKRKNDLIETIINKEAILFVGAGLSQHLYPSWKGLICKLEDLAIRCNSSFKKNTVERENRPWHYVDTIKKHITIEDGNIHRYYNELRKIFTEKNCENIHRKIISLPFIGFITTNYDILLEKALIEKNNNNLACWFTLEKDTAFEVSDFFFSLNSSLKKQKKIAHLHGIYSMPATIILSYQDYLHYYGLDDKGEMNGEPKLHYNFLWSTLATRRVIFVGFSMEDLYLLLMLRIVCKDLWRWQNESHFLITSINNATKVTKFKDSKKILEEFGISTVFYDNEDGTHQNLEYLFDEISQIYDSMATTKEKEFESANKEPSKIIDVFVDKNWIETINRKMINRVRKDEA